MDKKFVNVYLYLFDSQYVVNKYKKEEDVSFQMRPLCLVIRLGPEHYIFIANNQLLILLFII